MADTTRTVKARFDGDTTGLERAAKRGEQEIDRFTKNVDKKFRKSGDDSGKGFATGLKKWFSSAALKETGTTAGTVFGSGFLGALKTPVLGPAIAGALTAAAAVAAPAAGAVAASGLVLAFGAGIAGLGIAFAAQSEAVKKRWRTTVDQMAADLRLFSQPYETTLIRAADVADRVFAKFRPSLQAAFKETAPVVSEFVEEVGDGLEQLQPAVRPISEGFQAVLGSLGPALQSALSNTSQGLVRLAESVKQNPDGLADLVEGAGQLTNKALGLITALNDLNGKFEDLTGGTSLVDVVFGKANSKVGEFLGLVRNAVDPLASVKNGLDLVAGSADKATSAVGLTGNAALYFTQGLNQSQLAALGVGTSVDGLAPKVESLTTKYQRQKAATDALIESSFRLQNQALGLAGAQINYQAAVDAATASVRSNGRTLNDNTEKGRANHRTLLDVAAAANVQTQSMIESNKGLGAATTAASTARSNFSTLAQKMGLSKKEADKLAASLIALPPKKSTTVTTPGAKGAKTDVDGLAGSLSRLPKSTTVNVYRNLIETTIRPDVGVRAPGRASGGLTQPKRRYLVGERGPELAEFGGTGTGGPRILSAEQTRQELARADQPLVVENHIEIGGEVVRVVRTEIKANDRETKRRVTAGVRR